MKMYIFILTMETAANIITVSAATISNVGDLDFMSTGLETDANVSVFPECSSICKFIDLHQQHVSHSAIFGKHCFCGDNTLINVTMQHHEVCDLFGNNDSSPCYFTGFDHIFDNNAAITEQDLLLEGPPFFESYTDANVTIKLGSLNNNLYGSSIDIDGPSDRFNSTTCHLCNLKYPAPGNYFVHIEANYQAKKIEKVFINKVHSSIFGVELDLPEFMEVRGAPISPFMVSIATGTDMDVVVSINNTEEWKINGLDIPQASSYTISDTLHSYDTGKYYANRELIITEDSLLIQIEIHSRVNKMITLKVYQKECSKGNLCPELLKSCHCDVAHDLLSGDSVFVFDENGEYGSPVHTFKSDIDLFVTSKREIINVNVPVNKGDVIAVNDLDVYFNYFDHPLHSMDMPNLQSSVKGIPALSLITSIPFKAYLSPPVPSDPSGEFVYTVEVVNPIQPSTPVRVTKVLKYQTRITELSFLNAFMLADINNPLTVAMSHDGDPVHLNYTIHTKGIVSDTSSNHTVQFARPGSYEINVTAYNLINSLSVTNIIHVDAPITMHVITIDGNVTQKEPVLIKVNIMGGLDINATLFSNEIASNTTWIVKDAIEGHEEIINTTFEECGDILVKSLAKKKYDDKYTSNANLTVKVNCLIGDLEVTTTPNELNQNGDLEFSVDDLLSLNIRLTAGQKTTYNVSWGDGNFYFEDQSHLEVPKKFWAVYRYYVPGHYTVNITATAYGGGIRTYSTDFNVLSCLVPKMSLRYGNASSPVSFFKSDNNLLVASWTTQSGFCEQKVKRDYNIKEWELLDSQNVSLKEHVDSALKTFDRKYNRISYLIKENSLSEGRYILNMYMEYQGDIAKYSAFIKIVKSKLMAEIMNGVFQTIPFKQVQNDGNKAYYNFTFDASQSFDPDDLSVKTTGMRFLWECKVASSNVEVNQALTERQLSNSILDHPVCLNSDWTTVYQDSNKLTINTEKFLEGIEYEIRVSVMKDDRKSVFQQKIQIVAQIIPLLTVICITCQEKLNILERTSFQYSCPTCPAGTRFRSRWSVHEEGEPAWTDESKTMTGYRNPNLVIRPSSLRPNTNYVFELSIGFSEQDYESIYTFKLTSSSSPTGGSCIVSPHQGTIMDKYNIRCFDWTADEGEVKYQFAYDKGESKQSTQSLNQAPVLNTNAPYLTQLLDTTLPLGLKENDYFIKIKIKISNRYGQFIEIPDIPVQVKPMVLEDIQLWVSNQTSNNNNNGSTSNGDELTSLQNMLSFFDPNDTSDPEQIISAVLMKTTLLKMNREADENKEATRLKMDETFNTPIVKSEQELKEEEELKQLRQKETESMIDMISNVPITNIEELQSMNDALATATTDINDLNDNSQEKASAFLDKTLALIANMSDSHIIQSDVIQKACVSTFPSISNLLQFQQKSTTDMSKTSKTNSDGINNGVSGVDKVKEDLAVVHKLLEIMEGMFVIIEKFKVSNEEPTAGETKLFEYSLQKLEPMDLSYVQLKSFTLPSYQAIFPNTPPSSDVSIENINFKDNIFIDLNTSNHMKSEVVSLNLRSDENQKTLDIKNTIEPFVISIEKQTNKLKLENVSMFMPGKMVTKKIHLESRECNLIVSVNPLNDFLNKTQLHVFVQYGNPPTIHDYDLKFTISNKNLSSTNTRSSNEHYSIKEKSYIKHLEGNTFLLYNFTEFTYGHLNNSYVYLSMYYDGPMPDLIRTENQYAFDVFEERGAFNYSLKTFCESCAYWNEEQLLWTGANCYVAQDKMTMSNTVCHCNHLTAFGGFFVQPNKLPTLTISLLKEGYLLLVTVSSVLLLYAFGLVFARRADISDREKVCILPLIDNQPGDEYLYEVTVNTGTRRNAGTTSNVYLDITGEGGGTGVRRLKAKKNQSFLRTSSLKFVMSVEKQLGDIIYMRLWHDNSGGSWYIRNIQITDLQTEKKYVFLAGRWLAVDLEDGKVDCILYVASDEDLHDFHYIFSSQSVNEMSEGHIWYSVYGKPPISPFTRCQRLSVAMSLLFSVMVANLMFYGAVPEGTPETENNIQGFKFTWQQVFVAIAVALITLPINIILVTLFNKIEPANDKNTTSNNKNSIVPAEQETNSFDNDIESISSEAEMARKLSTIERGEGTNGKNRKIKQPKAKEILLPHWVLYPVWILCLSVVFGCAIVVVWYGMSLGNKKSMEWLASVTIGLIQDIMLVQPMKILFVALFVSLCVKKLEKQENDKISEEVEKLSTNNNWYNQITLDDRHGLFKRANTESLLPPNADQLSKLRRLRYKEKQLQSISKEIMLYLVFTSVASLLGFSLRDYRAFHQTRDIEETLRLRYNDKHEYSYPTSSTKEQVWDYLEKVVIEEIFPSKWFELDKKYENESFYDFPGVTFLSDMTSKIVTGARLRQLRAKPHTCIKVKEIEQTVKLDCVGHYSQENEQVKSYNHNWFREKEYKANVKHEDSPWRHQKASDLDGYPYLAEIHTYHGSGYVVEMFPKWDNHAILRNLKQKKWLDRYSRALFIEFAVFNGGTNYFDAITVVFEFPPWGGVVHFSTVTTFKLYVSTSSYAMFVFLAQILFLVFTLLFIARESRVIYKQGINYFTEFWNLIEFSNIVLSLTVIGFFFWRSVLAKSLSARLPKKSPDKFINLQFTAMVDQFMTYVFALICFCCTVKFMKLLRFNKRISMLSTTLKKAWFPLMMFGIQYGLILIACTLFSTLAFGTHLYGYKDNFSSFASVTGLLLGKFSYYQFENTNPLLGRIFFFGFNMFVNWIVMNMYISILNDVLSEVYADIHNNHKGEYEMVDYMFNSFKELLGISGGHEKIEAFEDALEEERKKEEEEVKIKISETQVIETSEENDQKYNTKSPSANEETLSYSKNQHCPTQTNTDTTQDNLEELLKLFSSNVDAEYSHLFKHSTSNEICDEFIVCLLIYGLAVFSGPSATSENGVEINTRSQQNTDDIEKNSSNILEEDRLSVIDL